MVQIDITNFKYKIIKTKKQNKNKMLFYHAINTGTNRFQCQVFFFFEKKMSSSFVNLFY